MQHVIGVRFQEATRISYYSSEGFEDVGTGEYVVVETSRGAELARVVIAPQHVVAVEITEPLAPIVRVAFDSDIENAERLKARAAADTATAREIVRALSVPMRIISGSYNLDGTRLSLFFTAEERVDFRDLLRDLQARLGISVQLRPIGPRDQAKVVDGYGVCGRRLCCSSWLVSFPAISIRMAKEQNKPLNPVKISGQCGRLLCCLAYENDVYKQLRTELPKPGTLVSTPAGAARVVATNVLRGLVTLVLESGEALEVPAATLAIDRGVVRIKEEPLPDTPVQTEASPPPAGTGAQAPPEAGTPPRGRSRGGPLPSERTGASSRSDRAASPGYAQQRRTPDGRAGQRGPELPAPTPEPGRGDDRHRRNPSRPSEGDEARPSAPAPAVSQNSALDERPKDRQPERRGERRGRSRRGPGGAGGVAAGAGLLRPRPVCDARYPIPLRALLPVERRGDDTLPR